MSLISQNIGTDMKFIEEGELLVSAKTIEEQLASDELDKQFSTFVPFNGRVLIKHLDVNDDKVMLKKKSGIFVDLKYTDIQINSKLNVGRVIKCGKWYNFYANAWIEFFKEGDIVLFEMVSYTPVIPNKYATVPFGSVHGTLTSYEEMAQIISVVSK
jgi:hypothetical protein